MTTDIRDQMLRQIWAIIAACIKANSKPTKQDMLNIMLMCDGALGFPSHEKHEPDNVA